MEIDSVSNVHRVSPFFYCTDLPLSFLCQKKKAMSKVCDGLRGDAFVAAQEFGFDHLCEIIDGRPCGIDTLINHQTKWRKYETVCLATTTLLDTPDSDGDQTCCWI